MTELLWEGKYQDGKRVAPVRIALPFQTIETINESKEQRASLFARKGEPEWRNRLIWGDKKYVLPSLLPEFGGKVNLIYIDPPFDTGANFSFTATIPDNPETDEDETTQFVKEPSIIEQKAYRDTWGKGMDSYLQWFYEAAVLLRELLAENGCIYVHLDWHVGHYVKIILDDIFGVGALNGNVVPGFRNEIAWCYSGGGIPANEMPRKHDIIFWYTKGSTWIFNTQYRPYSQGTVERGRTAIKGENAKLREEGTPINDWWPDVKKITSPTDPEKLYYDTQKSEELLSRIIKLGSNENDLIIDCFCGSGTTAAVAEKLNRRWIACDLGRFAIHTTRKRMLSIEGVKPFVVQNLGKYERQQWVESEFQNPQDRIRQEKDYRNFIIGLYHAQPITGYTYLHGSRAGRMVHVGGVEAPVSMGDVKSIVAEFWKSAGKTKDIQKNGIDVLGWEFAFDLNETATQYAASNKVDLKFKKIPREVLEKKAVEQGDIKFFELAYLDVKVKAVKGQVSLAIKNFVMPPDDIPDEVRGKVTHWSQWIDYWAVDWNYRNDTFHNEWQSYRTRQKQTLELSTTNHYETSGEYTILVKVIDILGNDTTKLVTVKL